MRRPRLLTALAVILGSAVLMLGTGAIPARANADDLDFFCLADTVATGASLTCNAAPFDTADGNTDAEDFTGTLLFTSTITNNFTVEPHDPGAGNEHKYTFKAGDLVDGETEGKDFTFTFNEPGTGTITAAATGLPDAESDEVTVTGAAITTTTTTAPTTSTTAAPGATTTTVAGASTTSTTAAGATTSTTRASTTTTARSGALPASTAGTGSNSSRDGKIAGALLLLGAVLMVAASRRTMRADGRHFS